MILDMKIVLIALLGTIAACSGSYFLGRWDGSSACDARHETAAMADYKKRTEEAEKKSKLLEGDLTKARAYAQKMERLVTYEVSKNDIYHSCVIPPSGVRLINEAIEGKASR